MLLASELAWGSNDFQSVAIHIFLWDRDFDFNENNICIINKFDMIEVDIVCVCVFFFWGVGGDGNPPNCHPHFPPEYHWHKSPFLLDLFMTLKLYCGFEGILGLAFTLTCWSPLVGRLVLHNVVNPYSTQEGTAPS